MRNIIHQQWILAGQECLLPFQRFQTLLNPLVVHPIDQFISKNHMLGAVVMVEESEDALLALAQFVNSKYSPIRTSECECWTIVNGSNFFSLLIKFALDESDAQLTIFYFKHWMMVN